MSAADGYRVAVVTGRQPYREPDERDRVPDSQRRWFIKQGELQQGPFAAAAISRSVKAGVLRRNSLVRAEDDTEWRPLGTVDALRLALRLTAGPRHEVSGWGCVRERRRHVRLERADEAVLGAGIGIDRGEAAEAAPRTWEDPFGILRASRARPRG
jgi:hypothetical protein